VLLSHLLDPGVASIAGFVIDSGEMLWKRSGDRERMQGIGVAEVNKRSTAILLVVLIGLEVIRNDDECRRRAVKIRRCSLLGFLCGNLDAMTGSGCR
jgi:hypothetical protein